MHEASRPSRGPAMDRGTDPGTLTCQLPKRSLEPIARAGPVSVISDRGRRRPANDESNVGAGTAG